MGVRVTELGPEPDDRAMSSAKLNIIAQARFHETSAPNEKKVIKNTRTTFQMSKTPKRSLAIRKSSIHKTNFSKLPIKSPGIRKLTLNNNHLGKSAGYEKKLQAIIQGVQIMKDLTMPRPIIIKKENISDNEQKQILSSKKVQMNINNNHINHSTLKSIDLDDSMSESGVLGDDEQDDAENDKNVKNIHKNVNSSDINAVASSRYQPQEVEFKIPKGFPKRSAKMARKKISKRRYTIDVPLHETRNSTRIKMPKIDNLEMKMFELPESYLTYKNA